MTQEQRKRAKEILKGQDKALNLLAMMGATETPKFEQILDRQASLYAFINRVYGTDLLQELTLDLTGPIPDEMRKSLTN